MKLFLCLAPLALSLSIVGPARAWAGSLNWPGRASSADNSISSRSSVAHFLERRVSGQIDKRDLRAKCVAATECGTEEKREARNLLAPTSSTYNITMAKRAMVLPTNLPAGMDEWLPEQVARAYDVTKQCTKSTSVFRALSDRRAESLGLSGLCGCTVLAIISREAVFMAHYFEDRSFNPNSEDELDGIPLTPQRAFDETVIKGLYEGLSHYQRSLSQFAGHFQRAATAFLITPSYGTGNRPVRDPYRPLLSQLKHAVQDIVPDLTRTGAWNEVQYNALDISSADLDDTARGSIVFKYDPYQQDVYPEHLAGLWFEYQQLYVDKW